MHLNRPFSRILLTLQANKSSKKFYVFVYGEMKVILSLSAHQKHAESALRKEFKWLSVLTILGFASSKGFRFALVFFMRLPDII